MNNLTEAEIAWLAGYYEGEGSAGIYRGYPRMTLVNTDLDVLTRAYELAGVGQISPRIIRGDAKAHWKPIWHWQITTSGDVADFLRTILPWLGARRGLKAREVIAYYEMNTPAVACELRTHCPANHSYSIENTRLDPYGHRHCRICDASAHQRQRDRAVARRNAVHVLADDEG